MKVFQYQMSRSVKSCYQVRQILALFCYLNALIWGKNCVKDIKVTNIVKEIKVEEVWIKLEAKNCFQRQSFTKDLSLTLVFMRNSALRSSLISAFKEFYANINKVFLLAGRLGTRQLFYKVLRLSWNFLIF